MARQQQAAQVIEKALPPGDQMNAQERQYFESGGEEGGPQGQPQPAPAPDPAAAPAPEPEAEVVDPAAPEAAQQPAQDGKPPKGFVPHGAFHEEREARKAAERREAEAARRAQTLEERTNLILQKLGQGTQQQAPAAPEIPPAETDPLGHVLARLEIAEKKNAKFENQTVEQRQQNEQMTAVRTLTTNAVALEQDFAANNPDYNEAASFLQSSRRQEYMAMGYNPVQANQAIQQEALQIANMAIQQGKNPAEVIYTLSKTRGFSKAAPASAPAPQPNNQAAVDQIRTVQNGQDQSRSLGNARGAAPAPLTADRLLKMSDEDFAKALSTPEGIGLMGS